MTTATSKVEKAEMETRNEQRILAINAWHLARYAIEHDHEIDLPEDFNVGRFIHWAENYPDLNVDDKIEFVNQYAMLERAAVNVTARTLVATRIHGQGFIHATLFTSVGQYLLFLALITIGLVYFLAEKAIAGTIGTDFSVAFYAAGLGTCVFLLRVTQQKLKSREFDPAYIPSQLIRLLLGFLAGGSIVLFPDLMHEGGTLEGIGIGQAALAFILGYAVNIFYAVLDNIGGKIKHI